MFFSIASLLPSYRLLALWLAQSYIELNSTSTVRIKVGLKVDQCVAR